MDRESLRSVTEDSPVHKKSGNLNEDSANDDYVDRKTGSRASSTRPKGVDDPDKIWTVEEILADEEIWRVTESSEDEQSAEEEK